MPEDIKPGDSLSNVKLLQPISLAGIQESHIKAKMHKVRMYAHPKGVVVERENGDTWLIYDAAIQAVRKEPQVTEPEPAPVKKTAVKKTA